MLLTMLLTVLLVATCSLGVAETVLSTETVSQESLLSGEMGGMELQASEDGTKYFHPTDGDPQLWIPLKGQQVNRVIVQFAQPVGGRIGGQLYYVPVSETLTEERSVRYDIPMGATEAYFDLPETVACGMLRLDINGSYAIGDLSLDVAELARFRSFEWVPFTVLLLLLILLAVFNSKVGYFTAVAGFFKKYWMIAKEEYAKKRWGRLLLFMGMCLSTAAFALTLTAFLFLSYLSVSSMWVMLALTAVAVLFQILYRTVSGNGCHVASVFLAVCLLIGLMMAYTLPITIRTAWDDQIHYYRTENIAALLLGHDRTLADYGQAVLIHSTVEFTENVDRTITEILRNDTRPYTEPAHFFNPYEYIAYYHNVAIIFLCDLFSIDFVVQMTLMKMMNMIIYIAVLYAAIKRLKSGGYLLAAVASFPTAMFLAAVLNYDFWVTAFIAYAYAIFISELQQPEKKITGKELFLMLGAMFLGCGPKAIYFVLIIPFLFLPKSKFEDGAHRKKYLRTCLIVMLVILLTFIVPFFISSDLKTDLRGGEDVNAMGQIKFILSDPIGYAKILLNYMSSYLSIGNLTNAFNTSFAYLGGLHSFGLTAMLLLIPFCAFTDKKECDAFSHLGLIKGISHATFFLSVVLFATALYVSFTPVGLDTVNGCQWRYLIPLLFPFFYMLGSNRSVRHMSDRTMSAIVFTTLSLVLLIGYSTTYIAIL